MLFFIGGPGLFMGNLGLPLHLQALLILVWFLPGEVASALLSSVLWVTLAAVFMSWGTKRARNRWPDNVFVGDLFHNWRQLLSALPAPLDELLGQTEGLSGFAAVLGRILERAGWFRAQGNEEGERPAQPRALPQDYLNLHVENFVPSGELGSLSARELRRRLEGRGLGDDGRLRGAVEKEDLVCMLRENGGSSVVTCSICAEDYDAGSELRVLRKCGHCYHRACIDHWYEVSPQLSHGPECPLCKVPIL